MEKLKNADYHILLWIQTKCRKKLLTPFWKGITMLGNVGIIWLAAFAVLWFSRSYRRVAKAEFAALVGSTVIIALVLKHIFRRPRPFDTHPALKPLIPEPKDLSFPSGHAGSSFACAVVLLLHLPAPFGVLFLILASLISFSRMYLGVHYLTDILAGTGIGIFCALLSSWYFYSL